jgi:hypothetical protein
MNDVTQIDAEQLAAVTKELAAALTAEKLAKRELEHAIKALRIAREHLFEKQAARANKQRALDEVMQVKMH